MNVLVSSSSLLLACAAFMFYDLVTFRANMVQRLAVQAQIIGENSVTALTFGDPHTGEKTLQALKAQPGVIAAGIYGRDGALFARYERHGQDAASIPPQVPDGRADSHLFDHGRLFVFHPIIFETERVGTVYIESDTSQIYLRFEQYGLIAIVVLAASMLLGLIISARLQRPLSQTILSLAATARMISRERDYSVRAPASDSCDELVLLTDTFNEMLSQIQRRSEALEQARQQVEQKVEQRTAELRQSEERFRLLIETVADYAIYMLDPEGRVTSWNHGAQRIKGYSSEEIIGQHFSIFHQPEDVASGKPGLALRIAAEQGRFEDQGWRVRKDGSRFWANVLLTALRDPQGRLVGFSKITRDLSTKKQAEDEIKKLNDGLQSRNAELAQANQELEAFTYSVSHDLRAPLRHIEGFSKLLIDEHGDELSEEAREYLSYVREGTLEMSQLVDDLLNLARIGRKDLELQMTGLDTIVTQVISGMKSDIGARKIEWNLQPLPFIECDPSLMKHVFTNLISNAVKYTRPREVAVIEVGSLLKEGQLMLFVRDNGVGFSMKHAAKLFGVFQRLHRKEDFEGTGVGLAIVDRIIRKHGGSIWPEAELNKGACFYFTIGTARIGSSENQEQKETVVHE